METERSIGMWLELSFPFWAWSGMPALHMVWQAGRRADTPREPRNPAPPFPAPQQLGGGEERVPGHTQLGWRGLLVSLRARLRQPPCAPAPRPTAACVDPGPEEPTNNKGRGLGVKGPPTSYPQGLLRLFETGDQTWTQSPGFLSLLPLCDFGQDFSFFGPHFLYILNKRAK